MVHGLDQGCPAVPRLPARTALGGPGTGVPAMKAFVYERYGPPETLRMVEVDEPSPGAGEVLVKVRTVSVNAADWHVLRGKPLFSRATLGLLRPKHKILGVDVAGQVEAVGGGVTGFTAGDQVYANLLDHGYGRCADGGGDRPPGPWPPRPHPARPAGADQWRFGWGRQLRGPARQVLRGRGDGGGQHPEPGAGSFAGCRPGRRLHHHRRPGERAPL